MRSARISSLSLALVFLGAVALAAAPGCGDDSTSEGPECGNGVREDAEFCDGTQFSGQTCVTQGFTGGELKCTESCSFDTSNCTDEPPTCGDGVTAGDEVCDGSDLGGETCTTQGFDGGTLACADDCGSFDNSQCENGETCGDGQLDQGEDCDGDDLGGATCASEGFTGGTLACADDCSFDTSGCESDTCGNDTRDAGEDCDGDDLGGEDCVDQGFDLGTLACAGDCTFDTSNCAFVDCGNDQIDGNEECDGAALGGATCISEGFVGGPISCNDNCTLNTSACLTCGDDEINGNDECDGADLGTATCVTEGFLNGNLACNPDCTFDTSDCSNDPIYTVGFCRLQFPTNLSSVTGSSTAAFGRVYVAGLTDLTGMNDPAAQLIGAVGYGPDGTDPSTVAWVWSAATPNAGYGPASPSYEMNNDEYQATLLAPAPGSYDFAYRFSGDGGSTWTYCDGGAGSSDGYQSAQAGQWTVTPPPAANIWINELHYDNQGTDADEGVEIAGPAGTDLTGYSLVTYNGANGMTYGTPVALSGIIDNEGGTGYGALWFPIAGLQNGDPDGVALIGPGSTVMYLLSYDGAFTAANGPAAGVTSTNIGVAEPDAASNPPGLSLQLKGGGDAYGELKWFAPSTHSRGSLNADQYLGANYVGFYPTLQGCQEIPANASTASGGGLAVVDTTAHNLIYRITVTGLGSAEQAAHIHGPAARGASAGVVFNLMSGSPKTGTVALTLQQETDILAGLYYFNIHTTNFPNGEVRAQIDNLMTCP